MIEGRFYVELHNSEAFLELQGRCSALELQCESLTRQLHEVSLKYGQELFINSELIDLCREHGISFRPALDRADQRKQL